ncbi:MAG: SOS response-associated peptidase [Alphaproteobacteria bacterium]|nr:SOS response-associated peptidase [Alphaproteobacteria bacterium]
MCGRFTQTFTYAELHAYFDFFGKPLAVPPTNLEPKWHVRPTDSIWVVTHGDDGFKLEHMRWGLAPFWWKKPLKELPATFNARAETVDTKPMFREAFKRRRCLIPASGYYEWQDTPTGKQPWFFSPASAPLFLIAALWETRKDPEPPGDTVRSTTMIITEPNAFTARYHDRMPVLLDRGDVLPWLTEGGAGLLRPAPDEVMRVWPVARTVNSSKAPDSPELVRPIEL